MSQTLQNQILLAKSMNGIVTLSDGAGTTISNGSIDTSNVNSSNITTNNLSLSALDLNSSLTLEQYDDIDTGSGLGLVSLWEKGKSYFTYLPQSLATPSLDSHFITRLFANNNYGRLTISNTWSATNNFTGGINVGGVPIAVTYRTGGSNSNLNTGTQPFQFIDPDGYYNMAYGTDALKSITTGDANAAFGYGTLQSLTTGGSNVAFGNLSLTNCTTGILNLAFGYNAGGVMVSSLATSCIGYNAGNTGFQGNYVNLFGINSYIASSGLSYSTCLGTGSFIDANNQIALGTSADTVVVRGNTNLTAGTATTTTQATSDNSTKIATTAFVKNQGYITSSIFSSTNTWTGVNTFNNNFVADCPITTGSILLKYDNTTMIEISKYALYSPISISPAFGQITFNYSPVFRSSFSLDNFITMNIGSAYGTATLLILNGSLEVGPTSGIFKTNTIEPYATASNTTWYSTCANSTTLTFGNSATTNELSIQFAKTIFNRGLRFNGTDVLTGIVDTGTANQAITARKDFNGFDNTIPNYCGSSFVSPVFRPRLFSLADSINNSCHAFGSNSARNLQVDVTNSAVYCLGQDNLDAKTLNCKNVTSIGGGSMRSFTNETFNFVTALGQGHLQTESGYSLSNVTMIGSNTTFTNGAIKPTSVTNALFNNAYGMTLASAVAISNVFGIRTNQPITKSNQGIIGDSTEITLHSTNQKVIVTGSLQVQQSFQSSIFSPQINYTSANYTIATPLLQYYHLVVNAATTITLPVVTSAMVGIEFIFRRRGGNTSVVSVQTTTSGGALQPIFSIGGNLGITTFPTTMLSAVQSVAKFMAIQSHFAGSGTGSCPGSSTTLTILTWATLPSAFITIGTRVTIGGFTKTITAYGTGTGGTGTYIVDTIFGVGAVSGAITSADCFGYDILQIQ